MDNTQTTIALLRSQVDSIGQELQHTEFKYHQAIELVRKLEAKNTIRKKELANEKEKLEYLQRLSKGDEQIMGSIPLSELKLFRGRILSILTDLIMQRRQKFYSRKLTLKL